MKTNFRPVASADRAFVERVYFETQRWIIEVLFGWRGDEVGHTKFADSYDEANTEVIVVDGEECGWWTVLRTARSIELGSIYIVPAKQRQGLGTILIAGLIDEATSAGVSLTLMVSQVHFVFVFLDNKKAEPIIETPGGIYFSRTCALEATWPNGARLVSG